MSIWRTKAVAMFPEMAEVIAEDADNPMSLWHILADTFESAYDEPRNESRIQRIYAFANWCLEQPRKEEAEQDLTTCVVVCFYEHIPTKKASREDMPRWFTGEEFEELSSVFGYHLGPDEFHQLRELFLESQGSRRKRKRKERHR